MELKWATTDHYSLTSTNSNRTFMELKFIALRRATALQRF